LDSIFPANNNPVTISYDASDPSQPALKLKINYQTSYHAQPTVNLDLATLANLVSDSTVKSALSLVSQFVDVSGSAKIDVFAGANLTLDLGLRIDPTTYAIMPFVYGDTGATLTARFAASNLNFNAAIGSLGLFVRGGSASLGDGASPTAGPASFGLTIRDATANDRIEFRDLMSRIQVGLSGQAHIDLPLFFPTATTPLGDGGSNHLGTHTVNLANVLKPPTVPLQTTDLAIATPNISAQFGFHHA